MPRSPGSAGVDVAEGRVVVLSSCTATKLSRPDGSPVSAESLYRGQQHLRLLAGVRAYRRAGRPAGELQLRIVSAANGVVTPRKKLLPYEETFAGLPREAIRRQAQRLGIPGDVKRLLRSRYSLALILLGDDYLEACALEEDLQLGGPTIAFCAPRVAGRLPRLDPLRTIALHNAEAKRFSCGLISLKGELGARVLSRLAAEPEWITRLTAPDLDILSELETSEEMALVA